MATITINNKATPVNKRTYWIIAAAVAFLLVVLYSVSIYRQSQNVSAFTAKPTASGKVNINNSQAIDRNNSSTPATKNH